MAGIIEKGVVSAVTQGGVDVRIDSASGVGCGHCTHCAVGAGGTMLMSGIADRFGVNVGDTVEVELPAGARLRASAISYGLPVLGLIAGYMAGFLLGTALGVDADAVGAVASVGTAIGMFSVGRRWSVSTLEGERFRPRVRAIISPSGGQLEGDRLKAVRDDT